MFLGVSVRVCLPHMAPVSTVLLLNYRARVPGHHVTQSQLSSQSDFTKKKQPKQFQEGRVFLHLSFQTAG